MEPPLESATRLADVFRGDLPAALAEALAADPFAVPLEVREPLLDDLLLEPEAGVLVDTCLIRLVGPVSMVGAPSFVARRSDPSSPGVSSRHSPTASPLSFRGPIWTLRSFRTG